MPRQATNGSTQVRLSCVSSRCAPEAAVEAGQPPDAVGGLFDRQGPGRVSWVAAAGGDVLHDQDEVERRLVDQREVNRRMIERQRRDRVWNRRGSLKSPPVAALSSA